MNEARQSLNQIGIMEGTDKASFDQDYLRHYERAFSVMRDEELVVMEIGVADGSSLRTWARFFPNASIIGVDINQNCERFATDRVRVEIGSQADLGFLASLIQRYRPNIVIDDGSHRADHILETFNRLFPFLAPGGIYVMENLYLHYGVHAPTWHDKGGVTPAERFAETAHRLAADHIDENADIVTRYLAASIDRIEFIRRAVIVHKKPAIDQAKSREELWALAEASNQAQHWFTFSYTLMQQGDLARAEIAAQRAVDLQPDNQHYLIRLAHANESSGNLAGAVRTASQLVALAPGDQHYQALLAHYTTSLERPEHER